MDLVLSVADYYFFTPYVYPATWPEDNIFRQTISLLIVTNIGAYILYFICATLSYYFVFDHDLMKHPQFLKNQVYREIKFTVQSLPWISIPTVLLFLLELRGYSKLYDDVGEFPNGWFHLVLSVISFLFFTDMLIYWIHRGLHHRLVYKGKWQELLTSAPCPFVTLEQVIHHGSEGTDVYRFLEDHDPQAVQLETGYHWRGQE